MDDLDIDGPISGVVPDENLVNFKSIVWDICCVRILEKRDSLSIGQWHRFSVYVAF